MSTLTDWFTGARKREEQEKTELLIQSYKLSNQLKRRQIEKLRTENRRLKKTVRLLRTQRKNGAWLP